jgi:hypothetical protein
MKMKVRCGRINGDRLRRMTMQGPLLVLLLCLTATAPHAFAAGGHAAGGGGHSGGFSGASSHGGFGGRSFSGASFGPSRSAAPVFSGTSSGHSFVGGFAGQSRSSGPSAYPGSAGQRQSRSSGPTVSRGFAGQNWSGSNRSANSAGYGQHSSSNGGRTYSGGHHGNYVPGHYYGGRYYHGGYYGGHQRYYYSGCAPYGAAFGFFMGGVVVGGIYSPFWWPYYAVSVPVTYYDPYYQYSYSAPPYVIEVPPPEATVLYQPGSQAQGTTSADDSASAKESSQAAMPPNRCYAPATDSNGNIIEEDGNMVPDFSKPVPCPPQE